MGKVMSTVHREIKNFNIENRAHRFMERGEKVVSPKYKSNVNDMQRTLDVDPDFIAKLNTKDRSLDDRLKKVYVTSTDGSIEYRERNQHPDRPLPQLREHTEDFEYGFKEPRHVSRGRCTLRQAIKFITDHQSEPEVYTKHKIAEEYKMKVEVVDNILRYYRNFNVFLPDLNSNDKLLQANQKQLKG